MSDAEFLLAFVQNDVAHAKTMFEGNVIMSWRREGQHGNDMRKTWQQAESKDSKFFRAKRQKGSGNQDWHPGDMFSDKLFIDSKQTNKRSYSISQDDWKKLENELGVIETKDPQGRIPILSIHLPEKHLVVVGAEDFFRLIS